LKTSKRSSIGFIIIESSLKGKTLEPFKNEEQTIEQVEQKHNISEMNNIEKLKNNNISTELKLEFGFIDYITALLPLSKYTTPKAKLFKQGKMMIDEKLEMK
jgi:hypothetical protein